MKMNKTIIFAATVVIAIIGLAAGTIINAAENTENVPSVPNPGEYGHIVSVWKAEDGELWYTGNAEDVTEEYVDYWVSQGIFTQEEVSNVEEFFQLVKPMLVCESHDDVSPEKQPSPMDGILPAKTAKLSSHSRNYWQPAIPAPSEYYWNSFEVYLQVWDGNEMFLLEEESYASAGWADTDRIIAGGPKIQGYCPDYENVEFVMVDDMLRVIITYKPDPSVESRTKVIFN